MGMYQEDKKSENAFDNIRQIYEESKEEQEENAEDHTQKAEKVQINPGLLALHEQNPDCIGWITIEGTAIDYPVMYHPEEKNYYLRRNFEKEYDVSGTPFVAEICDPEESDNLIIYGHHMEYGAMFGDVVEFKNDDYFQEHKTGALFLLDDTYKITLFACVETQEFNNKIYNPTVQGKDNLDTLLKYIKDEAVQYRDIPLNHDDKIIGISTCAEAGTNERVVLFGRLDK